MQRKKLGQVFLKDGNHIRKIVDLAHINADETVVEVGCGEGCLTEKLALLAKQLVVIEVDETYAKLVSEQLSHLKQFTMVHADVLEDGFDSVDTETFKIVSNLPYLISAPFVQLMCEKRHRISEALIMFQHEFAQKMVANPAKPGYTSLSVYTSVFWETSYEWFVPKTCFQPVPKVDSAVIRFVPKKKPLIAPQNQLQFSNLVRSAFWGRRKPLRSALLKSPYLNLKPSDLTGPFITKMGSRRGETLTVDEFIEVFTELELK